MGIRGHAFFILGFPGETIDEMKATNDLANEMNQRYGLSTQIFPGVHLYPGTDAEKYAKDAGLAADLTWTGTNPSGISLAGHPVIIEKPARYDLYGGILMTLGLVEMFNSLMRPVKPSTIHRLIGDDLEKTRRRMLLGEPEKIGEEIKGPPKKTQRRLNLQ